MTTPESSLSLHEALRAYARMMNTLRVDPLEPLLAEDFHYESQWVFTAITSKREFLEYIVPKLDTIMQTGSRVWAEMAELSGPTGVPCLVLAQGDPNRPHATLLIQLAGGKIQRADLCMIPHPAAAQRTGDYPK
jgi:hypothetical protein